MEQQMQTNNSAPIKGIVCFDLDGTLLINRINVIPQSAQDAIAALKKNCYKVVLSTGRDMETHYSRQYKEIIKPDAIIHQNGGKITIGDKLFFRHLLDHELLKEVRDFCLETGICMGTCIGGDDFFINPDKKTAADKAYNKFITRHYVPFDRVIDEHLDVTGLAYAGPLEEERPIIEKRFPNFELLAYSSGIGADVVEKGFSKAEGLRRLCEYYGVSMNQTYAFGDSANDAAILQAVHVGVAMGNADQVALDAADYITDDMDHDGIWNACKHLGLI